MFYRPGILDWTWREDRERLILVERLPLELVWSMVGSLMIDFDFPPLSSGFAG